MNGRVAKQLRKDAYAIASLTFGQTESVKLKSGQQVYWERYSPKAIYKALKKAYYTNTAPEY